MDDSIRRRSVGAPAARSILLTILGEYVLPRRDAVWQETLVGAVCAMGYSVQAARQAVARTTREGWLVAERHGRRARMTLAPRTVALLQAGTDRIYGFGRERSWDGEWLVVVLRVPEAQRDVRHQVRSRLAWAGLGSMGGGLWLTPHTDREDEIVAAVAAEPAAEAVSFRGAISALGDPLQVAQAAWDLDRVRDAYDVFVEEFSPVRASTPEACFRRQTALVHAWRRFPFLDPDLPADLLPKGWPRRRAHRLFHDRHARWDAGARAWFEAADTTVAHGQAAIGSYDRGMESDARPHVR